VIDQGRTTVSGRAAHQIDSISELAGRGAISMCPDLVQRLGSEVVDYGVERLQRGDLAVLHSASAN